MYIKQAGPISQNLGIESGRHTNVTKENHLCKLVFNIKNSDSNILRNIIGKNPLFINLYNY